VCITSGDELAEIVRTGAEAGWPVAVHAIGDRANREALDAFERLSRLEGIIPALESAHAVAWVLGEAGRWRTDDVVIINLSGRGDKDVAAVAAAGRTSG